MLRWNLVGAFTSVFSGDVVFARLLAKENQWMIAKLTENEEVKCVQRGSGVSLGPSRNSNIFASGASVGFIQF